MSLTVKAYLEKEDKSDEIRRFTVPADVSSSYHYLVKKVASIFPSLREGHFSLYWRDPDGDLVLFSTDEEQLEALGFISDSLFKIFIKIKETVGDTSTAQPQESHGKVHQGVICDGCNGQVRGIRYKCMECDDYDLCAMCEQKARHPEHNMMKITKPSRAPFYVFPPHRGHGMQRHGIGRFPGPGGHCGNGEFAPPPHFRRWMRRFMRRWHSENTPGCPMEQDSPDDELSPPEGGLDQGVSPRSWACRYGQQYNQNRGGKRSVGKCSPRSEQAGKKSPTKKRDMIIDLTAGIDQSVTMETEKSVEGQNVTEEESSTEEITSATEKIVLDDTSQEPVVRVSENDGQPPEPTKLDVQHGNRRTGEDDSSWLLLNVAPNGAQATPGPGPSCEPGPTSPVQKAPGQGPADQATVKAADASSAQTGSPRAQIGSPSAQTGTSHSQTGTTSARSGTQTGTNSGQSGSRTQTVQFQIPPQIFYPPSDPRVAESLKQMMLMGFNNDGGWLTRLLEDKNGDIIQVLDAVKPQPGRSRETSGGYLA